MIRLFSPLKALFKPRYEAKIAQTLYGKISENSRVVDFYTDFFVEDTQSARFEMLNLHMALVILCLRSKSDDLQAKDTAQALIDVYMSALDNVLREDGVGDLSVAKKMKNLAGIVYQRFSAIEQILAPLQKDHIIERATLNALGQLFERTIYAKDAIFDATKSDLLGSEKHINEASKLLALYVTQAHFSLSPTSICEGFCAFPKVDFNALKAAYDQGEKND